MKTTKKLGKLARQFAATIHAAEAKGLVHTTGGGGSLAGMRRVWKAYTELERSGEFIFVGEWEGGYIVTPKAARRYGMQALLSTYCLKRTMDGYFDPSLSEDGPISLPQLKKLAKKVRAMEKHPIIDDWDCDVAAYDPKNLKAVAEALVERHMPTFISGLKP